METLIVIVACGAAIAGGWILLTCLAGRRAELVKAFNMQQEAEARRNALAKETAAAHSAPD